MTDNELLLQDLLQKISHVINKYGEENFALSFSGGKDSTVLSSLLDMACPENKIPRVFSNTGIEYRMILDFVEREREREHLWELVVLKPSVPIKPTLEKFGYPFKSKMHSKWLDTFQRNGHTQSVENYIAGENRDKDLFRTCPKKLLYQFKDDFNIRVSDKCCFYMKEKPLDEWRKQNRKPYSIVGIMKDEGGRRAVTSKCMAFSGNKFKSFHPLVDITKEWEDWFIKEYNVDICDIYKPPYNFERTGCKGCPFALHLQNELDMLEKYFPSERRQCELIWEPIYNEYRRINYRLKPYKEE